MNVVLKEDTYHYLRLILLSFTFVSPIIFFLLVLLGWRIHNMWSVMCVLLVVFLNRFFTQITSTFARKKNVNIFTVHS